MPIATKNSCAEIEYYQGTTERWEIENLIINVGKSDGHVVGGLLLDQKEYSLRWIFEGKGVLLFD